jgi:GTPase involved in cell partitioning and DNA repair
LWTVGVVKIEPQYADLGEEYWAAATRFRFEAAGAPSGGEGGSGGAGID